MGLVGIPGPEKPSYLNYSLWLLEVFQWGKKGQKTLYLTIWDKLIFF